MSDRTTRALLGTTLLFWLVMIAVSPSDCAVWRICLFDAPRAPYGPDAARLYLSYLGETALHRYLWVVQPLDLIFPALLCLAFRETFARLAPERLAMRLGRLAVLAAGADYLENALIRVMLKQPGGDFPDLVPLLATGLTTVKWILLAFLFAALARLLLAWRSVR